METLHSFGMILPRSLISEIVQIISELVLTSTKFMSQVCTFSYMTVHVNLMPDIVIFSVMKPKELMS